MSRSRSPDDRRRGDTPPHDDSRMEVDQDLKRDRPDEEDEPPVKRPRAEAKKDERARGKRLFGNILGTLQRFQKDDKSSRTSEAAKRREEVSERIQNKIRSEATLHHDIAESERELKALRIQTDGMEYVLRHKEVAMIARHASLAPTSRYLHTSIPTHAPLVFQDHLLNPSPIPLNKGPTREPPHPEALRPLYFLPKILLPAQKSELDSQISNIDELITDEKRDLIKEKNHSSEVIEKNRARIVELSGKLVTLRAQVKDKGKEEHSGFGGRDRDREERGSRGDRDWDRARDGARPPVPRREDRENDRDRERERDAPPHTAASSAYDREAGVMIKGEDGDIEVEY